MSRRGEIRKYNILALVNPKKKCVYLELSYAANLVAVLRKHWRGENPVTKDVFSRDNPDAVPEMWVWSAGYMSREEALAWLLAWRASFETEGYEILWDHRIKIPEGRLPRLDEKETNKLRVISVSGLLSGCLGKRVECAKDAKQEAPLMQKYVVEPADEVVSLRLKWLTACTFREFCEEHGLTQNQGLELLLAERTGNVDSLVDDLHGRLEKADQLLTESRETIVNLRQELHEVIEGRDYPSKYQRAMLQNQLLRRFMAALPEVKCPAEMMIRKYSNRMGKRVFPERSGYEWPEQEGIIRLKVEHMHYSKSKQSCLFIYGLDDDGKRRKVRWYFQDKECSGESMRESPYLCENAVWLLAVQKVGDVMQLVGSLPDPAEIWKVQDNWQMKNEESDRVKDWASLVERYVAEADEIAGRRWYGTNQNELDNLDILDDKNASLDEKIKAVENGKK